MAHAVRQLDAASNLDLIGEKCENKRISQKGLGTKLGWLKRPGAPLKHAMIDNLQRDLWNLMNATSLDSPKSTSSLT